MATVEQFFVDFDSGTLEFSEKTGQEVSFEKDHDGDLSIRVDLVTDMNTFFLTNEQAVALRDFLNERFS